MTQDIPRAIACLERTAEKGNAHASYLAGKIYLTEDAVKDVQKAIRLLEAAAAQGNDYAEYRLGLLYLCGRDTERDYLSDRANKDGECWPAIPTIAAELKLSQSTVRRALHDLRKAGLIETEQRYRTKGGKSSLLYKLRKE